MATSETKQHVLNDNIIIWQQGAELVSLTHRPTSRDVSCSVIFRLSLTFHVLLDLTGI